MHVHAEKEKTKRRKGERHGERKERGTKARGVSRKHERSTHAMRGGNGNMRQRSRYIS